MACLWSGYIHNKADITKVVEFASGTQFGEIGVARKEFRDLASACGYLEDCIARNFIPWVAVFSN